MPRRYPKPRLLISQCIEFKAVRWNAAIIRNEFVRSLIPHVDFVQVCPEVAIGLGIPRETLRLVRMGDEDRLIQPSTGKDLTDKMVDFGRAFVKKLPEIDGCILKGGSPSSAYKDAKIYSGIEASPVIGSGPGIFAREILKKLGYLPIEDDGRFRNPNIRDHFLKRIYAIAGFRKARERMDKNALAAFHKENKLLFKSFNQDLATELGRIIAAQKNAVPGELFERYFSKMLELLIIPPKCGHDVNIFMHQLGYFKKDLKKKKKAFFLKQLDNYKEGNVPFASIAMILKTWIMRFGKEYLRNQTYLDPYPEELMDIDLHRAYCDGKDYWKHLT